MKRIILSLALVSCWLAGAYAQEVRHVVLISIDGFRPEFYEDKNWPAPVLQRLAKEGVQAPDGIQSVFPSVTYPSHTTLTTGAYPARHGVYYNTPFNAKEGHWYWNHSYIKTKTLWDALQEAGLTSAAFMWPATVGAPITYNFPVRRPEEGEKGDQLTVTRPHVTPETLYDEIESKATGKLTVADFRGDYSRDSVVAQMANYVIATYKPTLTAIHFLSVDHTGHAYGRDAGEVKKAAALVDSLTGTILQTLEKAGIKDHTAVIITGDHGMSDIKKAFSPNVYLARHGLIKENGWSARFKPSGGSAFLYLKDKQDTVTLNKVRSVLASLPDSSRQLFRIVERDELDEAGADPDVAIALASEQGVAMTGRNTGEPVVRRTGRGTHGFHPGIAQMNTGFIAAGAGINKQARVSGMGIKDVAPVVARLLGLVFEASDGILFPDILAEK